MLKKDDSIIKRIIMKKKKDGFDGQKAIVIPRKILDAYCDAIPLIRDLYVTDIGYYPKAKHHYRERIGGADQHILIYCIDGKGHATIRQEQNEIRPGDFILIPAGTAHVYEADTSNPWTIIWVHFTGSLATAMVDTFLKGNQSSKGVVYFQTNRVQLFDDMYANLEMGYSSDILCYTNLCFKYFLASFVYKDNFNRSEKQHTGDLIEISIEFMKKNIDKQLSLDDLAQAVHLSASHYSFLFRKRTGFSPIEHFNHLKVQKACQFLLFTNLRIKEIADKLGVEDQYYFSRMFSKIMGISPAGYRVKRIN